jgi:hypothetical protein
MEIDMTNNTNDAQSSDGFNAWLLREFGPNVAPEQVVARFKDAWEKGIQGFEAQLAATNGPALYEINFTNCQTPWFTIPAQALSSFLETDLPGFEYRPLYRGLTHTRNKTQASTSRTVSAATNEREELQGLIKNLRELARNATPGPWAIHSHDLDDNGVTEVYFLAEEGVRSEEEIFAETLDGNHDGAANAAYIAAANPKAIRKLCDALERLLK